MKTYIFAAITAFVLSAVFCRALLPVLKKFKAGQNILSYVKEHKKKSGTPTMGGLSFIAACLLSVCLFSDGNSRVLTVSLALFLAFAAVGFLDDFLKIKRGNNLGLKPYQKIVFQSAAALLAGFYCYRAHFDVLRFPFTQNILKIGGWIVPLVAFLFLSLVNAVNLTDGLDGLAGGASAAYFLCFGLLLLLQSSRENGTIESAEPLVLLCFCAAASVCGFLIFNVPPASVFMGDTGSLALGGLSACVAAFSGNVFFVPILGLVFLASVISVIAQVIYYKATRGKRIFLMSPVHHHFQQKGFSESKISFVYASVTMLAGLIAVAFS